MPDLTLQTPDGPERLTAARRMGRNDGREGVEDQSHQFATDKERVTYRIAYEAAARVEADTRDEPGVEPGLAERLLKVLMDATELVDEVPEGDDLDGGELLEAAVRFEAVVRHRFPDPDDLTNAQRAMVAAYMADELDGRHGAFITLTGRGPVVVGDVDMRLTRVERAVDYLARFIGGQAVPEVERHLYPKDTP